MVGDDGVVGFLPELLHGDVTGNDRIDGKVTGAFEEVLPEVEKSPVVIDVQYMDQRTPSPTR
jgi:hypothetical protein